MEHRDFQSLRGELVAIGLGDALDEAMRSEATQIVAHAPRAVVLGLECRAGGRDERAGHCQLAALMLQSLHEHADVDLPSYSAYRFPATVMSHCVWLYFPFSLSYRDVEEMMVERGVVVTYETIREWCQKFGQAYAKRVGGEFVV